jgi:hypothetical protein
VDRDLIFIVVYKFIDYIKINLFIASVEHKTVLIVVLFYEAWYFY